MASTEPGSDADALRRLEERLDRAAAAAERLLGDAAAAAGAGTGNAGPAAGTAGANGSGPVPPAGWQVPGSDRGPGLSGSAELDLLLAVLASLRDRIPPDLQQRLAEAVREVLLAVRALIDWYLERSQRPPAEPAPIQDIPIL